MVMKKIRISMLALYLVFCWWRPVRGEGDLEGKSKKFILGIKPGLTQGITPGSALTIHSRQAQKTTWNAGNQIQIWSMACNATTLLDRCAMSLNQCKKFINQYIMKVWKWALHFHFTIIIFTFSIPLIRTCTLYFPDSQTPISGHFC